MLSLSLSFSPGLGIHGYRLLCLQKTLRSHGCLIYPEKSSLKRKCLVINIRLDLRTLEMCLKNQRGLLSLRHLKRQADIWKGVIFLSAFGWYAGQGYNILSSLWSSASRKEKHGCLMHGLFACCLGTFWLDRITKFSAFKFIVKLDKLEFLEHKRDMSCGVVSTLSCLWKY